MRSDAKRPRKRDIALHSRYFMCLYWQVADVLVQTLVPPRLAKWVKGRAEREGLAVAAWLRRLIMMQEAQSTIVRAWVRPDSEQVRRLSDIWATNQHPHILLDRVLGYADGTAEFAVYDINGRVFTRDDLVYMNALADKIDHGGWFALDGSSNAWRVVSSMFDAAHLGQLRVTLRPEARHPERRYEVTPSWWKKASERRRQEVHATFESQVKTGAGATSAVTISTPGATPLFFVLAEGHGGLTDEAASALSTQIRAKLEAMA